MFAAATLSIAVRLRPCSTMSSLNRRLSAGSTLKSLP